MGVTMFAKVQGFIRLGGSDPVTVRGALRFVFNKALKGSTAKCLLGKFLMSVPFQCHGFHHRLAIFLEKTLSVSCQEGEDLAFSVLDSELRKITCYHMETCYCMSPNQICIHSFIPRLIVLLSCPQLH